MGVSHIEFLVEEPSMEVFLRGVLPKLLNHVHFEIRVFQGKKDLLRHLPERLRGYARWMTDDYKIVVVVDKDADACQALKQQLEEAALESGLPTRSRPRDGRFKVINRIAIEELEAWYFGDWDAVRAAYPRVSRRQVQKEGYRDPDGITGGTWEALERLLQGVGYFAGGFRKIEAARTIAPHIDPHRNQSKSFQVFRDALVELTREP